MKIKKATVINGLTLLVYYTRAKCWQYAIDSEVVFYESERIFYTAEAAELSGEGKLRCCWDSDRSYNNS